MWSQGRYSHMEEFVREAGEFGFTQIELNYALTPGRLRQLLSLDGVKVSSVHCPCPVELASDGTPIPEPQISVLDKDARRVAVELGKSSIQLAARLGAKVVILHAGRVEIGLEMERRLHYLYNRGMAEDVEFGRIKDELVQRRQERAGDYLDAARESLHELAEFAAREGVWLGLETRIFHHEIPTLEEMEQLLGDLSGGSVGYWHDVGHAEVQSRLGFTPHREWFSRFGGRLLGVHLHDVRGIRDHCAPGVGSVDWGLIAANLPDAALRVCEIGEWNDVETVPGVVPFLRSQGVLRG